MWYHNCLKDKPHHCYNFRQAMDEKSYFTLDCFKNISCVYSLQVLAHNTFPRKRTKHSNDYLDYRSRHDTPQDKSLCMNSQNILHQRHNHNYQHMNHLVQLVGLCTSKYYGLILCNFQICILYQHRMKRQPNNYIVMRHGIHLY